MVSCIPAPGNFANQACQQMFYILEGNHANQFDDFHNYNAFLEDTFQAVCSEFPAQYEN